MRRERERREAGGREGLGNETEKVEERYRRERRMEGPRNYRKRG